MKKIISLAKVLRRGTVTCAPGLRWAVSLKHRVGALCQQKLRAGLSC